MRLNEFNEFDTTKMKPNSYRGLESPTVKITDFIKTNCSEFLTIAKKTNELLYRGYQDSVPKDHFIGYPRQDRKPSGLSIDLHNKLIKCFDLVGLEAPRNKTISCTSSMYTTIDFGDGNTTDHVYVIFPLNGFKYSWSTKFDDIGALGQGFGEGDDVIAKLENISLNKINYKFAEKMITSFGFTNKNLEKALKMKHEVAVEGKYLAVLYNKFFGFSQEQIKNKSFGYYEFKKFLGLK